MVTTSLLSSSSTVTSPIALTTPFIQHSSCASIWDVTEVDVSFGASKFSTAIVSDAADPRFAACQPSGWADRAPESRFSFSPAVCPSAWTYYGLSETVQITQGRASTYSTAYCCASGFTPQVSLLSFPISSINDACISILTAGQPAVTARLNKTTGFPATITMTEGALIHQAWHVSWASSDTGTLSPSLPALTSSKYLQSWVPGQTVAPGEGDRAPASYDQGWDPIMKFVMIGIPIIGVAILASCVACCVCFCRAKKKQRAAQLPTARESSNLEAK